jgi:predicted  nucleic acid-binding Zn-ribbon protein
MPKTTQELKKELDIIEGELEMLKRSFADIRNKIKAALSGAHKRGEDKKISDLKNKIQSF